MKNILNVATVILLSTLLIGCGSEGGRYNSSEISPPASLAGNIDGGTPVGITQEEEIISENHAEPRESPANKNDAGVLADNGRKEETIGASDNAANQEPLVNKSDPVALADDGQKEETISVSGNTGQAPPANKSDAGAPVDNGRKEETVSAGDVARQDPPADKSDAAVVADNVTKEDGVSDNVAGQNPPPNNKDAGVTADNGQKEETTSLGDNAVKQAPPAKNGDAEVLVDNGQRGETIRVGLVSWRDLPFQTVKHQAYDYSCGSAALATLMTYVYDMPTSEKAVFKEMFDHGDQEKIRREGFSMLDMSDYLNAHGFDAKGYKITEDAIEEHRLPFIALVNNNGYNHFVVVKTMGNGRVLVGDPNTGNTEYAREAFAKIWNGLALVVVNYATKARDAFGNQKEWRFVRAHAPIRNGNDIGNETAGLSPAAWQIFPTASDMMPAMMMGTVATTTLGGGS